MHLRHQPLELATKLFNSTLISSVSGADGMDPELHWYGCHPGNTDLVDLASGGIGKNIQTVCNAKCRHGTSVSGIVYKSTFDLFHMSMTSWLVCFVREPVPQKPLLPLAM